MTERRRTRRATLRALAGIQAAPDVAALIPAHVFEGVEHGPPWGQEVDLDGVQGVWFWTQSRDQPPDWLDDIRSLLGHDLDVHGRECGVLLAFALRGSVYTVTYGSGWRWIGDEHVDATFGLRVVVRSLDETAVRSLVSQRFGQGRTDATHVAGGAPVWALRPAEFVDVVRRLAGEAKDLQLTRSRSVGPGGRLSPQDRRELLDGATGLRLPLGVDRRDLVADVREIDAVLDRKVPDALKFIDNVHPVSASTASRLDGWLEGVLGTPEVVEVMTLAVPPAVLALGPAEVEYVVDRGAAAWSPPELHLTDLLGDSASRPAGTWLARLRRLSVEVRADGRQVFAGNALRWLEVEAHLDDRDYYLIDGDWLEVDPDYVRAVREEVRGAFRAGAGLRLPAWPWSLAKHGPVDEKDYNAAVGAPYICLDRKLVREGLHRFSGIELCDLLGPGGVYVHVKRAKDGASLSHLFAQGANALEALENEPEIRAAFRRLVTAQVADGDLARYFTPAMVPRRLVFAVLKESRPLTADNLPPMAAVSLARTMRQLRASPTSVEVVAIDGDRGRRL